MTIKTEAIFISKLVANSNPNSVAFLHPYRRFIKESCHPKINAFMGTRSSFSHEVSAVGDFDRLFAHCDALVALADVAPVDENGPVLGRRKKSMKVDDNGPAFGRWKKSLLRI
jgi:hypothetical protein